MSDSANTQGIYSALAAHQQREDWALRGQFEALHAWGKRMNAEFELGIGAVALRVDRLAGNTCGHYRAAHNGFGLRGEIAISTRHLSESSFGDVLGTLLHELVHAWQFEHGTPSPRHHHNAEFCTKAESLGLIVDSRGQQSYPASGPFRDLLMHHGVEPPPAGAQAPTRLKGSSKNKKYACMCPINIRCAVELYCQCLHCGQVFRPSD